MGAAASLRNSNFSTKVPCCLLTTLFSCKLLPGLTPLPLFCVTCLVDKHNLLQDYTSDFVPIHSGLYPPKTYLVSFLKFLFFYFSHERLSLVDYRIIWSYQSASCLLGSSCPSLPSDHVGWGKRLRGYVSLENTFLSFGILSRISILLEQMKVCTYPAKACVS